MKDLFKRTKANTILMALLSALLGIVLIAWPTSATVFICLVAGWVMLIGGIFFVIIHFLSKSNESGTKLLIGIIGFALGLWIVLRPGLMIQFISVLFGIVLLLHGFTGLQDSLVLKNAAVQNWWLFTIFAVVTILLGIFVIWAPVAAVAATIVSGVALVFDGITNLITGMRVANIKKSENNTMTF